MDPACGHGISLTCATNLQLQRFASGGWGEVEPLPFWDSPTSGWGRLVGLLHRCWDCMVCVSLDLVTDGRLQSASPPPKDCSLFTEAMLDAVFPRQ